MVILLAILAAVCFAGAAVAGIALLEEVVEAAVVLLGLFGAGGAIFSFLAVRLAKQKHQSLSLLRHGVLIGPALLAVCVPLSVVDMLFSISEVGSREILSRYLTQIPFAVALAGHFISLAIGVAYLFQGFTSGEHGSFPCWFKTSLIWAVVVVAWKAASFS